LVAEIDDQVGGFCRCGPTRDPDDDPATTGELYAMYVHPDRWRNRIGAALMRAAVDHLATDRYAAATLWVLADNAAGIAFYTAQGWRRDGGAKLAEMGSARPLEIRLRRALGANP
jgi:ribosomal protein S18 acetylase RimI-like enzyme